MKKNILLSSLVAAVFSHDEQDLFVFASPAILDALVANGIDRLARGGKA